MALLRSYTVRKRRFYKDVAPDGIFRSRIGKKAAPPFLRNPLPAPQSNLTVPPKTVEG
jgi:hypothetical protein